MLAPGEAQPSLGKRGPNHPSLRSWRQKFIPTNELPLIDIVYSQPASKTYSHALPPAVQAGSALQQ